MYYLYKRLGASIPYHIANNKDHSIPLPELSEAWINITTSFLKATKRNTVKPTDFCIAEFISYEDLYLHYPELFI